MLSVAQTGDFAAAWRRTWTGMDSDFLLHSLGGGAIIAAALTLARLLLDHPEYFIRPSTESESAPADGEAQPRNGHSASYNL